MDRGDHIGPPRPVDPAIMAAKSSLSERSENAAYLGYQHAKSKGKDRQIDEGKHSARIKVADRPSANEAVLSSSWSSGTSRTGMARVTGKKAPVGDLEVGSLQVASPARKQETPTSADSQSSIDCPKTSRSVGSDALKAKNQYCKHKVSGHRIEGIDGMQVRRTRNDFALIGLNLDIALVCFRNAPSSPVWLQMLSVSLIILPMIIAVLSDKYDHRMRRNGYAFGTLVVIAWGTYAIEGGGNKVGFLFASIVPLVAINQVSGSVLQELQQHAKGQVTEKVCQRNQTSRWSFSGWFPFEDETMLKWLKHTRSIEVIGGSSCILFSVCLLVSNLSPTLDVLPYLPSFFAAILAFDNLILNLAHERCRPDAIEFRLFLIHSGLNNHNVFRIFVVSIAANLADLLGLIEPLLGKDPTEKDNAFYIKFSLLFALVIAAFLIARNLPYLPDLDQQMYDGEIERRKRVATPESLAKDIGSSIRAGQNTSVAKLRKPPG